MEQEIQELRQLLQQKDTMIASLKQKVDTLAVQVIPPVHISNDNTPALTAVDSLDNPAIARYSRQLILPEIGVNGQLKLKNTSVLIVGAGGLGCPSAVYLAAAGIGRLGIVDYDNVELSNLHRQVLHTESRVDVAKSASVSVACNQLNSSVECVPYHMALNSTNALDLIKLYDIVLDATDNVATRYLLNDACVLAGKPLVSGSALRFEGQLTVYNHNSGPCYRCLYPKPPPPETVTNCSDGGVLGVVPGIIGCIQALEAIKIATGLDSGSYSGKLLLFDALQGSFRTIRLRGKQPNCRICGQNADIKELVDYEQFCGAKATDKSKQLRLLEVNSRISVQDYQEVVTRGSPHVLIDVRQPVEQHICQLKNTINIPIDKVDKEDSITRLKELITTQQPHPQVYVVCRLGNDSQVAVNKLKESLKDIPVEIKDIRGGLTAWAKHIDPNFPVY